MVVTVTDNLGASFSTSKRKDGSTMIVKVISANAWNHSWYIGMRESDQYLSMLDELNHNDLSLEFCGGKPLVYLHMVKDEPFKIKIAYDICQLILKNMGLRACVISRGYGGKTKYPHTVNKNDTFNKVGDEPIILSKNGEVIVSKNKKESKTASKYSA